MGAELDRQEKILRSINLRGVGIELGPLDKPVVRKSLASISYVDHLGREALRKKYQDNEFVVVDAICDVDVVIGKNPLASFFPEQSLDYVVASHVMEHLPNPIRFLDDCCTLLRTGGILSLALPNKTYSFDYLRRETKFSDWVSAYLDDASQPSTAQIADHMFHVKKIVPLQLWTAGPREYDDYHSESEVVAVLQDENLDRSTIDCHLWVFTVEGCVELLNRAILFKRMPIKVETVQPTTFGQMEFFVQLRRI